VFFKKLPRDAPLNLNEQIGKSTIRCRRGICVVDPMLESVCVNDRKREYDFI
jgi:hypothetical protein